MTGPTDRDAVVGALSQSGIVDITTTGRRTGRTRRIEIDFFALDAGVYISGTPGRRDWMANLKADPRMTFHLKRGVRADLPATARIVTDDVERRPLLAQVTAAWGRPTDLEAFVRGSPLIEVRFDDPALISPRAPSAG